MKKITYIINTLGKIFFVFTFFILFTFKIVICRYVHVQSHHEFDAALHYYDRAIVMIGENKQCFESLSNQKRYQQAEIAFIVYTKKADSQFIIYKDGSPVYRINNFRQLKKSIEYFFGKDIHTFITYKKNLLKNIPLDQHIYYTWPYYDYYRPGDRWHPAYATFGYWPYLDKKYGRFPHNIHNQYDTKLKRWFKRTEFFGHTAKKQTDQNNVILKNDNFLLTNQRNKIPLYRPYYRNYKIIHSNNLFLEKPFKNTMKQNEHTKRRIPYIPTIKSK